MTIAIIALLASMLLPALTKAKGNVQGISCVNHMKQLGLATHLYGSDNQKATVLLLATGFLANSIFSHLLTNDRTH